MRPSSRPQSSNRYGDERSSRPARPRLNRETVDRAWESGAPNHHADYHPRSNNNRGQAPRDNQRNNWRDSQQQGQQGQYQPRNNRPPYGNQQGNYRRSDNTGTGEQRPQSRPYNPNRRNFDDRPHSNYQPRGNGSRPNYQPRDNDSRPNYRGNDRPYESRPGYRDNQQERGGYQQRSNDRYERGPRDFNRSDNYDPNRRPPRSFDRDNRNSRPSRTDYRDKQAPRNARDTFNPRWQSRPAAQREREPRERFKGDYEHFSADNIVERPERSNRPAREERPSRRPPRQYRTPRESKPREQESEERHVTQLPDGRVLKGSRPEQRKAAAYWTDIAQNTDELLDGIEVAPIAQPEQATDEAASIEGETTATPEGEEVSTPANAETPAPEGKPRKRAASAVTRTRKASTKQDKPRATGESVPRPSKRGFKWPTP